MKKYFLCTLFTLVATLYTSAFAGDSDRVVFVVKGEFYETPLSELKKITFTGGKLQAHMTDGSCDEYFLADMQKMYFSDVPASINTSEDNSRLLTVWSQSASMLSVRGYAGLVEIFGADGKQVSSQYVEDSSAHNLDLSLLPKGMYVLRLGVETIKIMKL